MFLAGVQMSCWEDLGWLLSSAYTEDKQGCSSSAFTF